jgi:hypothetical protein
MIDMTNKYLTHLYKSLAALSLKYNSNESQIGFEWEVK